MATDTSTSTTVESGDNHQRRALRALQHLGAAALVASFVVTYAYLGIAANEVLAPVLEQTPLWFTMLLQTGSGIPIVVALALTGHYVSSAIVERDTVAAWRIACYAAAVGVVALPVMEVLLPGTGAF